MAFGQTPTGFSEGQEVKKNTIDVDFRSEHGQDVFKLVPKELVRTTNERGDPWVEVRDLNLDDRQRERLKAVLTAMPFRMDSHSFGNLPREEERGRGELVLWKGVESNYDEKSRDEEYGIRVNFPADQLHMLALETVKGLKFEQGLTRGEPNNGVLAILDLDKPVDIDGRPVTRVVLAFPFSGKS